MIKYVIKTGDKYYTENGGYSKDIQKARVYGGPDEVLVLMGNEKVQKVKVVLKEIKR